MLDVASFLRTPAGKPRCAIVTTAHLSDQERQFVTTLVLSKLVTWMRRQPGTDTLRSSRSSLIAATSLRISSTGRSARPTTTQVVAPTSTCIPDQHPSIHALDLDALVAVLC